MRGDVDATVVSMMNIDDYDDDVYYCNYNNSASFVCLNKSKSSFCTRSRKDLSMYHV